MRLHRLGTVISIVLILPLVLGMAECEGPLAPSSPATFTLEPDESIRVDRTTVRFNEVVSESRCPLNAQCISAGDVVVEIDLTVAASSDTFTLSLNDASLDTVRYRGVVVMLEAVQPYPDGSPIDPDDYRATFEVVRD